jgi:riboflavin kinase, archaea type
MLRRAPRPSKGRRSSARAGPGGRTLAPRPSPPLSPGVGRAAPRPADLAILLALAELGGLHAPVVLSSREVGIRVGLSQQSADRRLLALEAGGWIVRRMAERRQQLTLTDKAGARLRAEHASYRRLFEGPASVRFRGQVRSGLGEGRYYLSLPGYASQFHDRLGYDPFPGTLNIGLAPDALGLLAGARSWNGVRIDGFEASGRTFGGATCFTAKVNGRACHAIVPDRTHHQDVIELIAPEKLRDRLRLADGDTVELELKES